MDRYNETSTGNEERSNIVTEQKFYDKSNMDGGTVAPREGGEEITSYIDPSGRERVNYPSLSREGLTSVLLPVRPGRVPFGVTRVGPEEILSCNFGSHVAAQVESAFKTSPAEAVETLHWYAGCAEGTKLLDGKALNQLKALSTRFSKAGTPEVYATEIRPFLRSLRPGARPKENQQ
jgi:hypothetical protein